MRAYQEFFAELQRRKVFKVMAVYGAVAFGLLQLADLLKNNFGLPETFVPFVTAIILLGFPLAVVLAWALEVTPDGVRKTEPATTGELAEIAARPAARRWPAGLLALAGFVALVGGVWLAGQRTGAGTATNAAIGATEGGEDAAARLALAEPDQDPRPTIAVLPFADMSEGGDQAYFSDGITEEILSTLARIRELKVAARTSAFAFRGRDLDMRAIGDSLGVGYLIEGSVRKSGDELRITAQLIDAADGSHLWAEQYDRTMDDVFAIQSEIAEAIAEELRVPLGLDDANDLVMPTADLEAYDLYLAGRGRTRERSEGLGEAIRLFEAAIARDSAWAPAWAGLAEANELAAWYPESWDEVPDNDAAFDARVLEFWRQAEAAANRALALDADNSTALVALGSVLRNRRQWEASERAYLRALASDPDNPEAHQQYGEMLLDVGRTREGRRATERAVRLDRTAVRVLWHANAAWQDGAADEANEIYKVGVAEFPDFQFLKANLFFGYVLTGRFEEAAAMPGGDMPGIGRYGILGDEANAVERLRSGDPSPLPAYSRDNPLLWMALGQPDSALTRVADKASLVLDDVTWVWDPIMDPIRGEPEMQAAMARLGLAGRSPDRTPDRSPAP